MTPLKKPLTLLLALLLLAALPAAASGSGAEIEDLVQDGENSYSCRFDGTTRRFLVYLPECPEGSGLILMLHGYGGSAQSFRLDTGLEQTAVAQGYTVVYVTGSPDPAVRTSSNGWRYESGSSDVAFLTALAEAIRREFGTAEDRVFAAGFSNGAFMIHCLAAEAGDTFSALVSVAGTMAESVWNNRPESCRVSLLQITGEKDEVIPKHSDGSARFAKSPAIEDLIAYYAEGLDICETVPIGRNSVLTKYTDSAADRQVWHLLVKDGRHSWSSERFTGIDTNSLILEFLGTQ